MPLRIVIVVACVLLLFLGIGYKFQEYNHLKNLVDTYQLVLTGKLTHIEEYNNSQEEGYKHLKTYLSQKPNTPIKDTLSNLDQVIKSAKLIQGIVEDYEKRVKEDREKFQSIKKSRLLLVGSAKGFSDKLLDSIDNYYQEEAKTAKNNNLSLDFSINLYETLKDYSIALNYSATSAKLPAEKVATTFYELSSLEKYSRDDFSFRNEEEIKKLMPYEYEILTKYKQYLKSYYTVVKDYVNGNYDSAAYKATRLTTDASNLTVDWSRIGEWDEAERVKRGKTILEDLITQLSLLKELKQNGIGKYPYVKEVTFNKKDLLLCHLYSYKKGIYNLVTSEYPKAKTIEDLQKELSTVSPKTNELDSEFDKDSMEFTNIDDKIEVICKDKEANKSYIFTTSK